MKIFTKSQISEIEARSEQYGVSTLTLMENAGKAGYEAVCRFFGNDIKNVTVVCGSGNNGGDGLVSARYFAESGINTTVILAYGNVKTDSAKIMLEKLSGATVIDYTADKLSTFNAIDTADVVVDALFGTGFKGEIDVGICELTEFMAKNQNKTVAYDLPSGVWCDSGKVSKNCVKAALTVAFISAKPCHIFYPSAEYCGNIEIVDIGVPNSAFLPQTVYAVNAMCAIEACGTQRPKICNKYDFGKALLVCGSYGMAGAANLAASAAIKCGTGLVSVCLPKSIYPIIASNLSEAVFNPMSENEKGRLSGENTDAIIGLTKKSNAVLIGCGMGCDDDTAEILKGIVCDAECPVVIDADGINCLAKHIDILKHKKADVLLTPHMGEMSRLCGISADEIQNDILSVGSDFAQNNGVYLVLKGARTVTFTPDGKAYVNTSGNSGMATAGSGDMLAGMLVSLLAQGIKVQLAAISAVYLHGESGDAAVRLHSQRAMTPTDMINCLDGIFLKYEGLTRG